MRIKSITLHNFRIYKDTKLEFKKFDNDIHVIIGRNGMGKTTLVNAINWCLYGEEPHNYSRDNSLEIANLTELNKNNGNLTTFVEIVVDANTSELTFKRELIYKKGKQYTNNLRVIEKRSSGETINHIGEDAISKVNNFVPSDIRDFFFFDGEQLDNYFVSQKAKNIKHNISVLSKIDVLESMSRRLNTKSKDYRSAMKGLDSNVDSFENKIVKLEASKEDKENQRDELKRDVADAEKQIDTLDIELSGLPDLDVKYEELNNYEKENKELETQFENKKELMYKNLFDSTPSILMSKAINDVLKIINEEEESGNLPPTIDEVEIRKSLDSGECTACHQKLSDAAVEYLNNIITQYKFSSEEAKKLSILNAGLSNHTNIIKNYKTFKEEYETELNTINKRIIDVSNKIDEINTMFTDHNEDEISKKFTLRKKLKNISANNREKIGELNVEIKNDEKEINNLSRQRDNAEINNIKFKEASTKRKLCSHAKVIVDNTMEEIRNITKKEIEDFTKKTFFKLLWKKETYSDVIINDDYILELIHSKYHTNSIGTASAAERELLVLAFTLGVHNISGFNSSLLIDTPLARVSDEHRVNFSEVLIEVSENKQIILIVTPDEFSENIQPLFDHIPKSKIVLNEDEDEAIFKEVL